MRRMDLMLLLVEMGERGYEPRTVGSLLQLHKAGSRPS